MQTFQPLVRPKQNTLDPLSILGAFMPQAQPQAQPNQLQQQITQLQQSVTVYKWITTALAVVVGIMLIKR